MEGRFYDRVPTPGRAFCPSGSILTDTIRYEDMLVLIPDGWRVNSRKLVVTVSCCTRMDTLRVLMYLLGPDRKHLDSTLMQVSCLFVMVYFSRNHQCMPIT